MSRESVEVVRAAYAAWNGRDLDAALASAHPEIEVVQDTKIPGAIAATGRDQFRAWLESFYGIWDSFEVTPKDVRQVGDRVLVVAQISARGKVSGIPVDVQVGHVLTLRDGQTVRWESYASPGEAREAVGLRE
jgi:ketosteroid isomerase-like protein